MEQVNKELNWRFKSMMEKREIDAAMLEYRTGVSAEKIMKYVRGEKDIDRAWAWTVNRLAEGLKCKVSDILNR